MLGGVVRPDSGNGAASYFSALFRHPHAHAGHSHSRHLHHHDEDLYDSSGVASGADNDQCSGQDVDCEVGYHDQHIIAVDVGKRRQIINTLVSMLILMIWLCSQFMQILQIGIMVHSLVIGLTLSIKTGPEFSASLR